MRAAVLTLTALVAFASNSVLARLALGRGAIDPASYSTIRLIAGACALLAVSAWLGTESRAPKGSWTSAFVLFLYSIPFSFSYVLLSTGTGALILFGSVQVTMMVAALAGGERPHPRQWLGLMLAIAGLVYLMLPGISAPSPTGAALMTMAGVCWGIYSLLGRGSADPLAQNAGNFIRAVPLTVAVSLLAAGQIHVAPQGALLAILSGAVSSGLGYVVWYAALRHMSTTRASVVQLPTPIIAAIGGLMVVGEPLTLRLVLSAAVVLGGIALALGASERRVAAAARRFEAGSIQS